MTDYTKKQPCGECGKMVESQEKHTYEDCLKWLQKLKDGRLLELAKKYGDNYTYGKIIESIKEDIIKPIFDDLKERLFATSHKDELVILRTDLDKIKAKHLGSKE
ncbi:hypothetical protein LCGC14_2385540 [marine sediment metagenome]|uniref:Uncharacterized protein n=1 Tax=marine sediment metagenome TaxID=412755 RepID=A0A0F9EUC4_9ZZZZ